MHGAIQAKLLSCGYPRNNKYVYSDLKTQFENHGISLHAKAFEIAVAFDGIKASFGRFHNNLSFNILYFIDNYAGYTIDKTSQIVGKHLIPFALDRDGYLWLVADDGCIYTDWPDVICLQGYDIISALEGAIVDYEGERIS